MLIRVVPGFRTAHPRVGFRGIVGYHFNLLVHVRLTEVYLPYLTNSISFPFSAASNGPDPSLRTIVQTTKDVSYGYLWLSSFHAFMHRSPDGSASPSCGWGRHRLVWVGTPGR